MTIYISTICNNRECPSSPEYKECGVLTQGILYDLQYKSQKYNAEWRKNTYCGKMTTISLIQSQNLTKSY